MSAQLLNAIDDMIRLSDPKQISPDTAAATFEQSSSAIKGALNQVHTNKPALLREFDDLLSVASPNPNKALKVAITNKFAANVIAKIPHHSEQSEQVSGNIKDNTFVTTSMMRTSPTPTQQPQEAHTSFMSGTAPKLGTPHLEPTVKNAQAFDPNAPKDPTAESDGVINPAK